MTLTPTPGEEELRSRIRGVPKSRRPGREEEEVVDEVGEEEVVYDRRVVLNLYRVHVGRVYCLLFSAGPEVREDRRRRQKDSGESFLSGWGREGRRGTTGPEVGRNPGEDRFRTGQVPGKIQGRLRATGLRTRREPEAGGTGQGGPVESRGGVQGTDRGGGGRPLGAHGPELHKESEKSPESKRNPLEWGSRLKMVE